jgi:hypothetical protein
MTKNPAQADKTAIKGIISNLKHVQIKSNAKLRKAPNKPR